MSGLRDEHALEATLARPLQRRAYDAETDLAELAAACGHGLATGHPFHDGNKRIAFVTVAVFLDLNGARLEADEAEVVTVMLSRAAGETTEEQLASWVRTRTLAAGQASG